MSVDLGVVIAKFEMTVSKLTIPCHDDRFHFPPLQFVPARLHRARYIIKPTHIDAHGTQHQPQRFRIGLLPAVCHIDVGGLDAVELCELQELFQAASGASSTGASSSC